MRCYTYSLTPYTGVVDYPNAGEKNIAYRVIGVYLRFLLFQPIDTMIFLGPLVLCAIQWCTSSAKSLRGSSPPCDVLLPPQWTTSGHQLFLGNETFHLKGINWNGVESDCRVVHGLWENSVDFYLDILSVHEFNALRIPIPFEVMEDLTLPLKASCVSADPFLSLDTTVGMFLRWFVEKAKDRGMFVLFDLHTIEGMITETFFTEDVSEDRIMQAWGNFASTFGSMSNVMGFEIKNEPHGSLSTPAFHAHCAKVIAHVLDKLPHFQGLFFIDGTSMSSVDGNSAPWGGTFESISEYCTDDALCAMHIPRKLVFSPHVYGPDVRGPIAIPEDKDTLFRRFGFIKTHGFFNESAIVVTEFGGKMVEGSADAVFFDNWLAYMNAQGLNAGAFFWTFPPTSFDTGGLLMDDFVTVDPVKVTFLQRLQPHPTHVSMPSC